MYAAFSLARLIKEQLPKVILAKINHFLDEVYASEFTHLEKVFNAIQTTDLADVKVVILKCDPTTDRDRQ